MWQTLTSVFAFLTLVGAAAIVLMSRQAEEARKTDRANVVSLNDLLKTREIQIADQARDLNLLSAEHKQLIQVGIKDMVQGWFKHQQGAVAAENARLRAIIEECEQCSKRRV